MLHGGDHLVAVRGRIYDVNATQANRKGAQMSGYTRVTRRGEFFELALTTPNMNFAMNPLTGESPEADYHARARERFERIFAKNALFIDEQMTAFHNEFVKRAKIRPFEPALPRRMEGEPGPCRGEFMVRSLSVHIAFDSAPAEKLREEIAQRLCALFIVQARHVAEYYEATLEADALNDDEPRQTRATLEQALAEAAPDLDAAVSALRVEQMTKLPILPYDASLPIARLSQKQGSGGPCRFDFRIDVPRGVALLLTLSAAPTNEQWIDLDQRLRVQQLELLRRKNNPAATGSKLGWFLRLFKGHR